MIAIRQRLPNALAMKTTAAVLHEMERPMPYADSRPMVIEELDLDGPGEGEVCWWK